MHHTIAKTLIRVVMFALAVAAAAACGDNSTRNANVTCSTTGKCPGDTPPTQMDTDTCNASLKNAQCGAKFQTLATAYSRTKCAWMAAAIHFSPSRRAPWSKPLGCHVQPLKTQEATIDA